MTAPQVYSTQHRVAFHETDAAGIVHFACFFLWMEQAEHGLLRSLGYGIFMDWEGHRISWPRVASHCEFQQPLRFEDVVDIDVSVTRLGRSSVRYRFDFSHQGVAVAQGATAAACCRIDPRPVAVPIPPALRDALTPYLRAADGTP